MEKGDPGWTGGRLPGSLPSVPFHARTQSGEMKGCRDPVHVGVLGGEGGHWATGTSALPGGYVAAYFPTSWLRPVSPPTLNPHPQPPDNLFRLCPQLPVSFTYVNDNPQEVIAGE